MLASKRSRIGDGLYSLRSGFDSYFRSSGFFFPLKIEETYPFMNISQLSKNAKKLRNFIQV